MIYVMSANKGDGQSTFDQDHVISRSEANEACRMKVRQCVLFEAALRLTKNAIKGFGFTTRDSSIASLKRCHQSLNLVRIVYSSVLSDDKTRVIAILVVLCFFRTLRRRSPRSWSCPVDFENTVS